MGRDLTSTFMIIVTNKSPFHNSHNHRNKLCTSTAFSKESLEIRGSIKKLKDLISMCSDRNRDINRLKNFVLDNTQDKDMDSIVNDVINSSFDKLSKLKHNYVLNESLSSQQTQHREIVCESMLTFLKGVCQSFVQERTLKAQRVMEHMDISRLQRKHPIGSSKNQDNYAQNNSYLNGLKDNSNDIRRRHRQKANNIYTSGEEDINSLVQDNSLNTSKATSAYAGDLGGSVALPDETNNISTEEMQEFEEENDRMYQEFTSSLNEIQSIEKKMVEISRLQDVLTENLLTQEESIDNVAHSTVNTTENIKQANVELLEALQHKAGFRVWILFILIVLTFSLLFLDWYNP